MEGQLLKISISRAEVVGVGGPDNKAEIQLLESGRVVTITELPPAVLRSLAGIMFTPMDVEIRFSARKP